MNDTVKTPWHLWVIGVVALLWNGFGANDYIQTQMRNTEYLGQMADQVGVPVQTILDHYGNFPAWADALWAIGVWGAVVGSVLLLLRSRFAFHAFAAAIVGLIGTTIYTATSDMPAELSSPMMWVFSAVIWIVTLLLIWYSKRMTVAGVLR